MGITTPFFIGENKERMRDISDGSLYFINCGYFFITVNFNQTKFIYKKSSKSTVRFAGETIA